VTAVIGFNSFLEAIMIADSRISWEDNQHPPQDILRKLYPLVSANKSAALGFSGDLEAARTIMQFLMEQKLKNYKRHFILTNFKDDLGRWIEEIAKEGLSPEQRTKIKFMLGGIEPSRHPPLMKQGQVVGRTPFVETHIYTYSIDNNGGVCYNKKPKGFAVIGTGRALERAIAKLVKGAMNFGLHVPQLHWARAVIMGEAIASCINENEKVSATVGGPFQVIRITSNGLETQYIWPPGTGDRNVDVQYDGSKTILCNASSKTEYILYPVWDLPSLPMAGAG
jgi:hypothetical protein